MNYTTILFDFDYTLADSSQGIVTCFQLVLKQHGYTDVTDEAIKRTIGKTLEESFSVLTGVTDEEQLALFKKEYGKEADTHMTVNTVLFLETKSVLLALKDAGVLIGIISTKYRFRIQELLSLHFPGNFFNIIIGGEDVKTPKPSPEGVLLAIKQLNVSKAETLYVGDSTIDAATARAAGVDFAGITHGVTTAEELKEYPHWKIMDSLEGLLKHEKEPVVDQTPPPTPEPEEVIPKQENIPETAEPETTTGQETTSQFPELSFPTPLKKKRISILQIILLVLLVYLSIIEPIFLIFLLFFLWYILTTRRVISKQISDYIARWLHPLKVRLRTIHIVKIIRGKVAPPANKENHTCLNCKTVYTGNYCNRCGQSRTTTRYRLSNAFKNIVGGFTNIDNGFGRTLIDLVYRPGYMIRDFISGKRIQYFRPFQTLFVLAALYIMMVQIVDPDALNNDKKENSQYTQRQELLAVRDSLQKQIEETEDPVEKEILIKTIENLKLDSIEQKTEELKEDITLKFNDNEVGNSLLDLGKQYTSKNSDFEKFLQEHPFLQKVWNLLKSWGHGNKAFRIIATLPLFALATFITFRRKKHKIRYNLTEHIFIQAYIACQILFISIIVLPFHGKAAVNDLYEVPVWIIFSLFCLDYKQLYGYTWWKTFWATIRMFLYCCLLIVLLAIVVIALAIGILYLLKAVLV